MKQEFQFLHILANTFLFCFITVILTEWIKELNLRLETKISWRKHKEIFYNIGLGNDFVGMVPKAQARKAFTSWDILVLDFSIFFWLSGS